MADERLHIIEELKSIGTILANLKSAENREGVPNDYFKELPNTLLEAVDVRENAKDLPSTYFNTLSNNILSEIDRQERKDKTTIQLQQYRLRERPNITGYFARVGVAAAVLIGLFLSIRSMYFTNITVEEPCVNDLACLEKEDLYNYVENNITTVTENQENTVYQNQDTFIPSQTTPKSQDITAAEAIEILTIEQEDALYDETLEIF
jgi:hypothetical protein